METNNRPAVELTDSLLVEGSVVLAHRHGHKAMSVAVLTREELQTFVQQAHDLYGVTADPFATPGSAEDEPVPFPHTPDGCSDPCQHDAEGDPWPEQVGYVAPRCERCANHDPRDRRDHGHLPARLTRGTAPAFA